MQTPDKLMPSVAGGVDVVVRTVGPPDPFIGAIRRASQQLDRGQVGYSFETMEEIVSRSISQQRFSVVLLSTFAAVALLRGNLWDDFISGRPTQA
jgi:hypothetical protein